MRASKNELTKSMENDKLTIYEGVWGEMHVEYDEFKKRFDVTPFLKGLPNDRDPCPHWGIVVKGAITIKYDARKRSPRLGTHTTSPQGIRA